MAKKITKPCASVVVTVYNELQTVEKLLASLDNQTLPPSEIVIVDGGSTDGTISLLQKLKLRHKLLRVYQRSGNRSVGRNFGVTKTSSQIIAFTDAGCIPESDWLEHLLVPFVDPTVHIVSGYYRGMAENMFQKCLIPYVLVMPDQAKKTEFYPSTRSMAITRTAWNRSGGFDIRLSHNEDYAYAHWLKEIGFNFTFAPKAIVNWLPRKNLSESAWMFLRFAIGDIQSGIIRPQVKRLFARFIIMAFIFSLGIEVPAFFYLFALLLIVYSIWSVQKNYRYVRHLSALFWLPVLQLTSDISILFGTIIGILTKS